MKRKGEPKRVLAILMAAALALTGPASSLTYVQAAEAQEDAAQDVSTQEAEPVSEEAVTEETTETASEEEANEETTETALEETAAEETTEAVSEETAAEETTETETDGAERDVADEVVEETVETEEETTETEETAAEDEDLTTKYGAPLLTLGTNEGHVLKSSDAGTKYFAFTADESGIYSITAKAGVEFDMYFKDSDYGWEDWSDDSVTITAWITAGETKYIKLYTWEDSWWDYDADKAITETDITFQVEQVGEEGTVSASDSGYTLSFDGNSVDLSVEASYTYVKMSGAVAAGIENAWLYIFQSGGSDEDYGCYRLSSWSDTSEAVEFTYTTDYLDVNTKYHFDYVVRYKKAGADEYSYDYFDGTGEPFDISTKSTDKEGGVITDITADGSSFTVKYELFNDAYYDGWDYGGQIRYRKNEDDAEWSYSSVWDFGSRTITAASGTTYFVELLSYDGNTVYDSASVTTEGEKSAVSEISVAVEEETLTANTAQIAISGYEGTSTLYVYVDYMDSYGTNYTDVAKYIYVRNIVDGVGSVTLDYLEAATEYKDIAVTVREGYNGTVLYNGALSFTTKEASFDKDNLKISVTQDEDNSSTAVMTTEISELSETVTGTYRYRINAESESWNDIYSFTLSEASNTFSSSLTNLSAGVTYELEYNIGGIAGSMTFALKDVTDLPTVTVSKTYLNGLDLTFSKCGTEDDTYYARVYVYREDYGYWYQAANYIGLSASKDVVQTVGSWAVIPGQTQQWKYVIYKNRSVYYTEYFEAKAEGSLELDTLTVTPSTDRWYLRVNYTATKESVADVIVGISVNSKAQYRKKGVTAWTDAEEFNDLWFDWDEDEDGSVVSDYRGSSVIYFSWEERIAPGEYEIRIVSADGNVVYGTADCTVEANWTFSSLDDEDSVTFLYDMVGTPDISIKNNDEAPTVEVENESIVSVRQTTNSKIYLDLNGIGSTTLYVTADGLTKELTVTVSVASELYFLEGADKTLADIPLPEKYSWADKTISPTADEESEVQYFVVTYKDDDGETQYGKVPVYVSRLDEITIEGRDTIGAGKERTYSVYYAGTGYLVTDGGAYKITQKWSVADANLVLGDRTNDRNVTVTAGTTAGTYTLTLTVTIENIRSGNTYTTTEEKEIRVIGEGLIDNLIISPAATQPVDAVPYTVSGSVVTGAIIVIDYDDYVADTSDKVQLTAQTDNGTETVDAEVTWSSADEALLAVDDTGLVTVKGAGEGTVNATAKDDGGFTEPVIFKILSYAPLFTNTSLTVNQGSSKGTKLEYSEQNEGKVTNIAIADSASKLAIAERDDGWYLYVNSAYSSDTTETLTLTVTTVTTEKTAVQENEEEDEEEESATKTVTKTHTYQQTLTVKVNTVTPTASDVTMKQTVKPNLFYVNDEAVFTVTSNYEIESISTKDSTKTNFHVKSYDAETGELALTAYDLKNSLSSYTAKNSTAVTANLSIKFKGYDDAVDYNITKITYQNKAISLKAEDAYVTSTTENALTNVLSGKETYDISGATVAGGVTSSKSDVTAAVSGSQLKLGYTGLKNTKYTLTLSSDDWSQDVKLSGKISLVDFTKLSLKASKTKATINTNYLEDVTASFEIKGNSSLAFTLNAAAVKTDAPLTVDTDHQTVTISAKDGAKSGSYAVSVWGERTDTDGNTLKTKTTKLTVTVTDKTPTLKLSAKGSLNLADSTSGITYTATVKNMDAEVSAVTIAGEDVLRFSAKSEGSNKMTVKAFSDATLTAGTKYTPKLKLTLSNGYTLSGTVTIKPVSKLPKVSVSATKATMTDEGIDIVLTYADGYTLSGVALDGKDASYYEAKLEDNVLHISLVNAGNKPTKASSLTYKLSFAGGQKTVNKKVKISF